jgi:hypothetical protein
MKGIRNDDDVKSIIVISHKGPKGIESGMKNDHFVGDDYRK